MRGLMVIVVGLAACTEPLVHKGKVTDRWGKPIAGVTIGVTGTANQLVSAVDGTFTVPVQSADVKLRAGKPGFIKKSLNLPQHAGESKPGPVLIAMYPDPEKAGFYAVTSSDYATVDSMVVKTVGTDIRAFNGMVDVGKTRLKGGKPLEFVFSSEARRSQLKQLGLQLHRLKFLESESVPGVLGETTVTLNLWVSDVTIPFDLTGMETDNDYNIKTREKLEPGVYAFHTQGILSSKDPTALDKLPEEMRVAFPFEVR